MRQLQHIFLAEVYNASGWKHLEQSFRWQWWRASWHPIYVGTIVYIVHLADRGNCYHLYATIYPIRWNICWRVHGNRTDILKYIMSVLHLLIRWFDLCWHTLLMLTKKVCSGIREPRVINRSSIATTHRCADFKSIPKLLGFSSNIIIIIFLFYLIHTLLALRPSQVSSTIGCHSSG